MKRLMAMLLVLLVGVAPAAGEGRDRRVMTIDDLLRFQRVSDPQISPDGKWVAYVVTTVDRDNNRTNADLWLAPVNGGSPRQLTASPKHDRHPRWSPDGKQLLFESNRGEGSQLFLLDLEGGEPRQLTTIATGASTGIWSPDGQWIAFVSAVYPEYSEKPYRESNALNKKRQEETEKNPVKARVFDRLFYRHWDGYVEGKRQHLFVMPAGGGEPRDVTPGDRDAYPTSSTFSIGDDFTFSPDSQNLVYTAPPVKDEAWSTNYDLWRVPITGGQAECLTRKNLAADSGPRFAPDGKKLAYRAQKRPGFEADKWDVVTVEVEPGGAWKGDPVNLTEGKDLSVEEYAWEARLGVAGLYLLAQEQGYQRLFYEGRANKFAPLGRIEDGVQSALTVSRDGFTRAFLHARMDRPAEVFVHGREGGLANVSRANDALLSQLDLPRPESVTVQGAGGTPMQMWILRPPNFDPNKKWPLVYLVHGGPQGAWEDAWSFRWNPQLWAAQGYVVALPNPRGSTGFGQKYVDEISGDWGGKCFEDLMKGIEYLENLPYIDDTRLAAAGASFGGYMMNWFQGHTTKFKTLITHCGVYNLESMWGTTDELWFDEWEHGDGEPPWVKRAGYEKHSPHRFAQHFRTPMLIIHNDLDFRVPVSEGMQLFATLQRRGVPSRFINFPDEGHWVLKPANSAFWHREVFAWLARYAPPGPR
jgi:dipeptidyl aminopeptidase/acylaminoacyl peptidase